MLDGPGELGANGGFQEVVGIGVDLEGKGSVAAGFFVGSVLIAIPDGSGLRFEDQAAPGEWCPNTQSTDVGGGVFGGGVGLIEDVAYFDLTLVVTGEGCGAKEALNVEVVFPVAGHDATTKAGGIPRTTTSGYTSELGEVDIAVVAKDAELNVLA